MTIFIRIGQKNKEVILPVMVMTLAIIIMGGSTNNPDYEIYHSMYLRGDQYKAPGFQFLIQISKQLGLDYSQFRLLVAAIGYILIYISVRRMTDNPYCFWIMYLIYPFCFDAVQLRNFLAMSLLVFATHFLVDKSNTTRGTVFFLMLTIIASTIQVIAIAYLPVVIIRKYKSSPLYKAIIILAIILSILIGLNKGLSLHIISRYGSVLLNDQTGGANYLQINNQNGWIINWFEQFANYGIIYLASLYCKNNQHFLNVSIRQKAIQYIDLVKEINMYCFLFLPMFSLDENYTRIIRNVMVINLIIICYCLRIAEAKSNALTRQSREYILCLPFCLSLIYQSIMFFMMFRTYSNTIFIPLLTQNIFI